MAFFETPPISNKGNGKEGEKQENIKKEVKQEEFAKGYVDNLVEEGREREKLMEKAEEVMAEKEKTTREKETGKEERFIGNLEDQGFLGEEIKEDYLEIKDKYKQQLLKAGKEPNECETWDDLIRKEMDIKYAEYLKTKVSEGDKELIDDFLESDEKNLLPLKRRQEFLNVLLRNNYSLYADKEGKMVSMSDYLKQYYKDTGAAPKIEFKTIDPDVKNDLAKKILKSEFLEKEFGKKSFNEKEAFEKAFYAVELDNEVNEKIRYILNDEIAFPHLVVETEKTKREIPLIAGTSDYHGSLRSEERDKSGNRKRKGHFVQSQIIHAPEIGGNIQKIISFNIHEADHAIREVLPTINQKSLDKRLLTEGTAEKASMDFMNTQHKYLKTEPLVKNFDGYDYQSNTQQVLGRYAIDEITTSGKEYRYAQGYMIAEEYNRNKGEENYKKLFYTGELDVNEELGDVEKIREGIDEKLKPQKKMFAQILSGSLGEKEAT